MPTTTWSHRERNAPPPRLMMMITSASAMPYPSPLRRAGRNITPAAQRGTDLADRRSGALTYGTSRAYRAFRMFALHRTARVICTVLVEAAAVVALVAIGRAPGLAVPVRHL